MGVRKNKLDSCKEKIEIRSYCPDELMKVHTQDTVSSRDFIIADLVPPDKVHLHVRTYVDHYGGYSEHGRNIIFGLQKTGQVEVKLTPIKSLIDTDPVTMQKCTWFVNNPAFKTKDSIHLTIAGPGWCQEKFLPKDGRYKIAWTMIESLNCHPDMKEWLENVDEVWAPTLVDVERFKALGLKNIKLMPLGYDEEKYNIHAKKANIQNLEGKYVFGVLGSWNKRKNIEKIVKAYCEEFGGAKDVVLLLVSKYAMRPYDGIKYGEPVKKDDTSKWDLKHEFEQFTKGYKAIPQVSLIDIPIHENVLPSIMQNFDSLVGWSMGESTWLPALQAMGMRIPIIQLSAESNGFIEYLVDRNSYLGHDYDWITADDELVKGTSEYYENQVFADGSLEELKKLMRKTYAEHYRIEQSDKIDLAYRESKNRTWKRSVEKVVARLQEIKNGKKL